MSLNEIVVTFILYRAAGLYWNDCTAARRHQPETASRLAVDLTVDPESAKKRWNAMLRNVSREHGHHAGITSWACPVLTLQSHPASTPVSWMMSNVCTYWHIFNAYSTDLHTSNSLQHTTLMHAVIDGGRNGHSTTAGSNKPHTLATVNVMR